MTIQVKDLSDSELLRSIRILRGKEKSLEFELLVHFGEVDERKLFRDAGFTSFYAYLNEGFGYSESSAYRRVQVARCIRYYPAIAEALRSGQLSFITVVELSSVITEENVSELLTVSQGKTKEELREYIQKLKAPEVAPKRKERVRLVKPKASSLNSEESSPLFSAPQNSTSARFTSTRSTSTVEVPTPPTSTIYEVAFQADEEFMKLYQEAKALVGGYSMKEVFSKVLKEHNMRKSPKERVKRREARKTRLVKVEVKEQEPNRHISAEVKDQVSLRDKGQCTYVSPSGHRCSCKQNLEYEHIKPFSLGGLSTQENLKLLCRSHNQLMAERVLGKAFMDSTRASSTSRQ